MNQYLEFFGFLSAVIVAMWGMMKFLIKDVVKEIQNIKDEIHDINRRMDKNETRIDHLYQLSIELLKERKKAGR